VEVKGAPPGTRSAVVRWSGTTGYNATAIFNHRIDADYQLSHGGFRPVRVTYLWDEGGAQKRHEHVARAARETYTIHCGAKPLMKSIELELAE
jgi:hypothetical protein